MHLSLFVSQLGHVVTRTVVGAVLVSSCSAQSPAPRSNWVTLSENAKVRMSFDTSRVERTGQFARVWIGFDLATPWPPMEDIRSPYAHYETRQEVDCTAGRAHGMAMRFVDTKGAVYDKPAPDSIWSTFETNGLTVNAFGPLCAALASQRRP